MRVLFVSAVAALLASSAVATAQNVDLSTTVEVEMMPGLVRIVRVDRPIGLILIGDPAIADTQVLGERGISITALGVGQTSIVLLDDNQEVITTADVSVVPSSRGLGRRGVSVRSFGTGKNEYMTHTYFCAEDGGRRTCSFDGSKRNFEPASNVAGATSAAVEPN
jgi:Flp pilus assembly secretin CpaC